MVKSQRRAAKDIDFLYLPIQDGQRVKSESKWTAAPDLLPPVGAERWGKASERRDGGVIFESVDCSPYMYPLSPGKYEPASRFGPLGTCPLCNNAGHAELDAHFARNLDKLKGKVLRGFDREVVIAHMAMHVGPVYCKTQAALDPKKASFRGGNIPGKGAISLAVRRALVQESPLPDNDGSVEICTEADIAWYDGAVERNAAINSSPAPERQGGRPPGARGDWYAFDGDMQVGAMRPWGEDRVNREIEKRVDESITFYSEMMNAREKASRIYDEVMDSDIDAANEDRGGKGKPYIERNYAAAIAAVREMRTIATDMAKLALIATKYSDGKEKTRVLSPVMQGMIDDIGVFESADAFGDAEDAEYPDQPPLFAVEGDDE